MEVPSIPVQLLIACITLIFIYYKNLFGFWRRRGVKYLQPWFPLGHFNELFTMRKCAGEIIQGLYNSTSEPFIGIFSALRPTLLIRNSSLVHSVLIKDFNSFYDRGIYIDEKHDLLSGHIFALPGKRWRHFRQKLSPLFSTVKLKAMFPTFLKCGDPLNRFIDRARASGEIIEMKHILSSYTTDIIGNVVFGLDCNSIDNPDDEFRAVGHKMFDLTIKNGLRTSTFLIWPNIQKFLKFKTFSAFTETFMIDIAKRTLEFREKNNYVRNDMFQLLMELRNRGEINTKNDDFQTSQSFQQSNDSTTNSDAKSLSIVEMAAQMNIFYVGGYETSSTTTSFCLFELAKRKDLQYRIQEEIDEMFRLNNNQITYDGITTNLKYMEACVFETLRKYPPLPFLNRICTIPYKVPGCDYTIELGTPVMIPILALHRDPKYYPDPLNFIPERFHGVEKRPFEEMPYLPFGVGPKQCIALRMGLLQTIVALTIILKDSNVELADGMPNELTFSPKHFLIMAKSGVFLKFIERN